MIDYKFKSVFARFFYEFIHMKEVMGYRTVWHIEYILKEFDLFFIKEGVKEPVIRKETYFAWRNSRVNDGESTLYKKISVISQFSRYMCHLGHPCYVPHPPKKVMTHSTFIPHIYTNEEIAAIFKTTDNLLAHRCDASCNMFSLPALLRTLYGTGMRISEACSLINRDVDLKEATILLRTTKNQQQRIVPISQSLKDVLIQYRQYRDRIAIPTITLPESRFFVSPDGTPVNRSTVLVWLHKILRKSNIPIVGGHRGPRLHDFRHTFAVHTLMRLVKEGADIYCVLPILAVYLGHKTLHGTENYVRLTKEMFPEIVEMESSNLLDIFPSIDLINDDDETL